MIEITPEISLDDAEIEISAVCSQGKGGQNVNKVSTAIHLRFDIRASSLPDWVKERMLSSGDHRITKDGVLVLKAQSARSQERNREAALERLAEVIRRATVVVAPRKRTKPSRSAVARRLETKARNSERKERRRKIDL